MSARAAAPAVPNTGGSVTACSRWCTASKCYGRARPVAVPLPLCAWSVDVHDRYLSMRGPWTFMPSCVSGPDARVARGTRWILGTTAEGGAGADRAPASVVRGLWDWASLTRQSSGLRAMAQASRGDTGAPAV
eukprot:4451855-Prymnesium_polylepis.2